MPEKKIMVKVKCSLCGKFFKTTKHTRIYCKECAPKAYKSS